MQWIMNNIQLVVFALVIASSILGPIFKWLGDKRQQLRRENERKRRELEELRTGRVEQTGPTAEQIERMIAEQMAAQQAEMLRQRAEQAEARRRAAQKRAEVQARKAAQAAQVTQPRPQASPATTGSQTYAQAIAKTASPMLPIEALSAREIGSQRRATVSRRGPGGVILGRLGPGELRRAIILTEVLGPPVSLRETMDRMI